MHQDDDEFLRLHYERGLRQDVFGSDSDFVDEPVHDAIYPHGAEDVDTWAGGDETTFRHRSPSPERVRRPSAGLASSPATLVTPHFGQAAEHFELSPGSLFGLSPAGEADPWFSHDAADPWTAAAGARRPPPPHYQAVPVFPVMAAAPEAPLVATEAAGTDFSMSGEPSSSRHAAPSTGVDDSTALM